MSSTAPTNSHPLAPVDRYRLVAERFATGPGPQRRDYPALDRWMAQLHQDVAAGHVSEGELEGLREALGVVLSPATMMGHALHRPHGYAGDFEIIDRMYRQDLAKEPHLAAWDRHFHQHAAAKAVRNRKGYFQEILDRHLARCGELQVLNVASGPGRCMAEWLAANPGARADFHCVELDPEAIAYARRLNAAFHDQVTFTHKNALRFQPTRQYDVVWSSGLFDYFSDKVFRSLLRRLIGATAPGGEVVIGNFSTDNPSRAYMELFGEWNLHHRTAEELRQLALDCGVAPDAIRVGSEAEGVNLFLHVAC